MIVFYLLDSAVEIICAVLLTWSIFIEPN